MRTDTGQTVSLADYRPTDFVLERVDLTFELDPAATKVESRLIFHRRDGVSPDAPLWLDGDELSLTALAVDQTPVPEHAYTVQSNGLTITGLPGSGAFEVMITTIIAPQANTKLMGLYRTSGVYCTQCEADGFRRITYFPDRPDVLAVYTVTIMADKATAPLLLSNGNRLGGGDLGDGRHFATWFDPHPKPCYLFALVAGDLGVIEEPFVTRSGRNVALKIYVEHGKEPRAAYAMDALKRSMRWDEDVFGCEYDLDIFMIVAVSDFNMGAMENKGLNIFNDKYVLADPETATDTDYALIEAIIAHEYFHNWTGNRITCRDWFQLCLKEGLTVYRDHEFSADQRSRAVKRIAEVRHLKAEQFPEDAGPLAHPVRPQQYREINNFYTTTVYEKGSEVTRMIATLVGPEAFKAGMDLYFARHDGQAATVEDFVACFEETSGRDLTQFSLWYSQAGTPHITVETNFDADARTFTLSLAQAVKPTPGQSEKAAMHIPLRLALLNAHGESLPLKVAADADITGDVLHLTETKQRIVFENLSGSPILSINRGFSAPVTLIQSQSPAELALIAGHETDLYARWQALTDLAMPTLMAASTGDTASPDPLLIETLLAIAADDALESAFSALALTLPSEADIARAIGANTDPDAIRTARQATLKAVANAGASLFDDLFTTMATPGPFTPDAQSAGKRALRAVALTYLTAADGTPDRAAQAFADANNMTDLSQALNLLVHTFPNSSEAKSALDTFATRFGDNPLVIDKWFVAQATIPGPDTLARVQALLNHPLFNRNNPNRLRSLIGTFAFSNPTGLHRADGKAYDFLVDQILEIDRRNPQVAARILTSLRSWRQLEPVRGQKAQAALARLASARPLSNDVSDIVERILEG
ncbi:aminopeptidase N [Rhizobium sp. CFBP 8762]|uniref:aminopeptidase N n=1 Tax=Rhizobium sp. CFBP 8762 TaxID=2775279 RepID=UPI00177F13C8|nr:aminopeptidase N [Rhizobium sp. CFBP 8762]MBD8553147.1 aminopeptidase N [Rhizobium sp. CFBP 8762]